MQAGRAKGGSTMSNAPDRVEKYIALVARMESPKTLELHLKAIMDALKLDREQAINKLYEQYMPQQGPSTESAPVGT
jgi:hypothetical protein